MAVRLSQPERRANRYSGIINRRFLSSLIIIPLIALQFLVVCSVKDTAKAATLWQPTPASPIHWQWQIGAAFTSADLIPGVTVYDIDLFDTPSSVVADLHSRGFVVIAYCSFGTYESWRPDASQFPSSAIGRDNGWPGENWLDVRSSAVRSVMASRLDLAKTKGFDAVEPDNIDGYSNSTGFSLSYQDQIDYNRWIASECHARGLSVGLKNDLDQAKDLQPYFDWALNEESYANREYSLLTVFTANNKAVFEVEYTGGTPQQSVMNSLRFNSMTRDLNLTSPRGSGYVRLPCVPDNQNAWGGTPQANRAPVLSSIGNKTVVAGSSLIFSVSATDLDGDTLTYTASGLPNGATFVGRKFSWTPSSSGSYVVTFKVSDGGSSDTEAVTITVSSGSGRRSGANPTGSPAASPTPGPGSGGTTPVSTPPAPPSLPISNPGGGQMGGAVSGPGAGTSAAGPAATDPTAPPGAVDNSTDNVTGKWGALAAGGQDAGQTPPGQAPAAISGSLFTLPSVLDAGEALAAIAETADFVEKQVGLAVSQAQSERSEPGSGWLVVALSLGAAAAATALVSQRKKPAAQ